MKGLAIAVLVFGLLIVLTNTLFVVREDQQVIITQFGRPVGNAITEPGLKFKLPFIQKTAVFDRRFLEWQGAPKSCLRATKCSSLSMPTHGGAFPTRSCSSSA